MPAASAGRRILIVDDEDDITESLKRGLQRLGFSVDAYNDPAVALANFKSTKYDIAILDIRMPKLNGFELYREMKKIDGQTTFCFLTAFDIHQSEFEKVFPDMSVKTFLRKPISISLLATKLNEILDQRQLVNAN